MASNQQDSKLVVKKEARKKPLNMRLLSPKERKKVRSEQGKLKAQEAQRRKEEESQKSVRAKLQELDIASAPQPEEDRSTTSLIQTKSEQMKTTNNEHIKEGSTVEVLFNDVSVEQGKDKPKDDKTATEQSQFLPCLKDEGCIECRSSTVEACVELPTPTEKPESPRQQNMQVFAELKADAGQGLLKDDSPIVVENSSVQEQIATWASTRREMLQEYVQVDEEYQQESKLVVKLQEQIQGAKDVLKESKQPEKKETPKKKSLNMRLLSPKEKKKLRSEQGKLKAQEAQRRHRGGTEEVRGGAK